MSQKLGTEKIEKVVDALGYIVIAGKKISADKKVDLQDLPAFMELIKKAPEIIEAFKAIDEVWKEAKDVDVAEAVDLILKINTKVKEIEKA
jgi:hypothetical protein